MNHIRANCPTAKPKEGSQEQKQPVISEYKRWQNKKGGDAKRSIDALTVRKVGATAIGARPRKTGITEWVLDTATDVHVCTDVNLLVDPQPDRQHLFLDFDGQPKGERLVGDVRILMDNEMTNQDEVLILIGAVHTPTGPDNFLSSHLLEEDGWEMSFKRETGDSFCCIKKGDLELRLKKTRGRYRLQARPADARDVHAVSQAANSNEDALQRWHMRFAHLNYPTLCRMISQESAFGFDYLCGAGAGDPAERCWSCVAAKQKRMSYKKTLTRRATDPYQKLMSDMCYVGVDTYDVYQHFQLIVDEATRWVGVPDGG